ncbi:unnamed protein product, partial [Protopolystoma xenopodis]
MDQCSNNAPTGKNEPRDSLTQAWHPRQRHSLVHGIVRDTGRRWSLMNEEKSSLIVDEFGDEFHSRRYVETPECEKHKKYRRLLGCLVYLSTQQELPGPLSNHVFSSGAGNFTENQLVHIESGSPPKLSSGSRGSLACPPGRGSEASVGNSGYSGSNVEEHGGGSYDCHKSHSGLFLGLVLFLATFVAMAIFFVLIRRLHSGVLALHVYQYSKITLILISLLACILALIQTRVLKFRTLQSGERFEYNLLAIGLFGCLSYFLFLLVPALESIAVTMTNSATGRPVPGESSRLLLP